jgi:hypothetical protein
MGWLSIGDWAEEEELRLRERRRERLKIAAEHFGIDVLDVLGDRELENRLLARYEAAGLPWPALEEEAE